LSLRPPPASAPRPCRFILGSSMRHWVKM
jgi:hypothetical protein